MIVLDTHALIFDAIQRSRLSAAAERAIAEGVAEAKLAICGITLWEIALLVAKKRIDVGYDDVQAFLDDAIVMRRIRVVAVNSQMAAIASRLSMHRDPADRLIVATTQLLGGVLVSADAEIAKAGLVPVVW